MQNIQPVFEYAPLLIRLDAEQSQKETVGVVAKHGIEIHVSEYRRNWWTGLGLAGFNRGPSLGTQQLALRAFRKAKGNGVMLSNLSV